MGDRESRPPRRCRRGGGCGGPPPCGWGGRGRGCAARRRSRPVRPVRRRPRVGSARMAARNRAVSSTTPRNTLPAPRRPAATAPWSDSVAPVHVSRAARTLGVRPWSASATRAASKRRVSPGDGIRSAVRKNASSVKVTWPMSSVARLRPRTVMVSGVGLADLRSQPAVVSHRQGPPCPGPPCRGSPCPIRRRCGPRESWCLATRPVGVWGSSGHELEIAGNLEARQALGRPGVESGGVGVGAGSDHDEGLHLFLGQLRRHADHGHLGDVGMGGERLLDLGGGEVLAPAADDLLLPADERVGAVGVLDDEVAGPQPAVGADHPGGLLGHPPVAEHDRRVAQLELADLAGRDGLVVAHDPALVDLAQGRVLADGAERAVGAGAPGPDRAVGRLRHGVAADEPQAEAALDLELAGLRAGTGRCRPAGAGCRRRRAAPAGA